jgi:hypothetical protein
LDFLFIRERGSTGEFLQFGHAAVVGSRSLLPKDHELLPCPRHADIQSVGAVEEANPPRVPHREHHEVGFPALEAVDSAAYESRQGRRRP